MNVSVREGHHETASPVDEQQRNVAAIISRGRQSRPGQLSGFLLACCTGVLLWASFTPLDFGPLAWISLVPLLLLVRPAEPTSKMYRLVYLAGLIHWIATLQWMRLGHVTMYGAMFALAAYLACYWPIFLALSRLAVHRLGIPLFLCVPVFWTGLEYLRSHLLTGFSWYDLGHSQYRWVEIIQISDLVGGYGVSFLVAAANGTLAGFVPREWLVRLQLCWPREIDQVSTSSRRMSFVSGISSIGLVVAALCYGYVRRGAGEFPLGPRVGLIQGNFTATIEDDRPQWPEIFRTHHHLSGLTVEYEPNLIVWPEAMFRYPMYEVPQNMEDRDLEEVASEFPVEVWRNRQPQQRLMDLADMTNAALVIGISTFAAHPEGFSIFNSAAFVQPGIGVTSRYDKLHRVPFGEYIPLSEQLPFLQMLTPFRGKFGIDAGEKGKVFRYQDWRFIPLICFEDTVPHLVRKLVAESERSGEQENQVLVNLTNDGWFHGSSELNQHLITASFRCVETRTPMVRAVNTGISAVIDGDGVVREPVKFIDMDARLAGQAPRQGMRDPKTGRFYKQLNCAIVADVPLDPRNSWYVRLGDWFGVLCLIGCVGAALQRFVPGKRDRAAGRVQS